VAFPILLYAFRAWKRSAAERILNTGVRPLAVLTCEPAVLDFAIFGVRQCGFPLACEVMSGNVQDRQTLVHFLKKIRRHFGKARRTWIMDRGIPTEETLALMRKPRHRISYLVGTPKGRLTRLERSLQDKPWRTARDPVNAALRRKAD
jgi:hypothetical protein